MNQANEGMEMDKFIASVRASVGSVAPSGRVPGSPVPDSLELELAIQLFRTLAFPGIFEARTRDGAPVKNQAEPPEEQLARCLVPQILAAMRLALGEPRAAVSMAEQVVAKLVSSIGSIRALLEADAQAAFDGDPAAQSVEEVILCYPGLHALIVHRFAHELLGFGAPLVPRMLAEIAHRSTGIDIHPGATIGAGLFIDHGTGVVIGQTTVIGKRCKIYQGVTLGAKSIEHDESGRARKNYKRHPTLKDRVTVYAGATILGGDTVIGEGCVVAGGVFLTESVPPEHMVHGPRAEVVLRGKGDSL